jgi:hypothetical protein
MTSSSTPIVSGAGASNSACRSVGVSRAAIMVPARPPVGRPA